MWEKRQRIERVFIEDMFICLPAALLMEKCFQSSMALRHVACFFLSFSQEKVTRIFQGKVPIDFACTKKIGKVSI